MATLRQAFLGGTFRDQPVMGAVRAGIDESIGRDRQRAALTSQEQDIAFAPEREARAAQQSDIQRQANERAQQKADADELAATIKEQRASDDRTRADGVRTAREALTIQTQEGFDLWADRNPVDSKGVSFDDLEQIQRRSNLILAGEDALQKEKFTSVLNDEGEVVGQRSSVTNKVITDPRSKDQTDKNELDKQRLDLSRDIEDRQVRKLSGASEKSMIDAQDDVIKSQRAANSMRNLASEYIRVIKGGEEAGGFVGNINEFLKTALGSEDEATLLRKSYNAIRASQAMLNLPPGPASDKDIALALSGFPTSTANAETVASFLRGSAKISSLDAAYNQFKADYINENRTSGGLNKAWRTKFEAPNIARPITMGDIYFMASEENKSPEEIKEELGIE